jgi:hypothetical protein
MAGRYQTPFEEHFDENGVPREGAKLFFYESGTSTKLDTYKVAALTGGQENTNPVVLDEFGRPEFAIFLQNVNYKVILATSTAADPPTGADILWTADPVSSTDYTISPIFKTGSGDPDGVVAGTAGSSGVLPTMYWDYTNAILYVCTTTGVAASAVWTAVNPATGTIVPQPQGRLTPTSQTPVITTGVSGFGAVYYTPYVGNLVPIYNGSEFIPTTFSQLTLTLTASHISGSIYDIFAFDDGGTVRLATGPAWSTATAGSGARGAGTALTRVNGLWVNSIDIVAAINGASTYDIDANLGTFLGSVHINGSTGVVVSGNGAITCDVAWGAYRKWAISNAYNRVRTFLRGGDSTSPSWGYASNVIRQSRGTAGNQMTVFSCLPDEYVRTTFKQAVLGGNSVNNYPTIGIGLNVSTAYSGFAGHIPGVAVAGGAQSTGHAELILPPFIGLNDLYMCEALAAGATSADFYGTEAKMLMLAEFTA